MTTRKT